MNDPTPEQVADALATIEVARATVDLYVGGVISPAVPCECGEPIDGPTHLARYACEFAQLATPGGQAVLLAVAVARLALGETERVQHVDEIARLTAELDIERARADHTKARLRRRIYRANRGRAALRATARTETRSEA